MNIRRSLVGGTRIMFNAENLSDSTNQISGSRVVILKHLQELQADYEDFSDEELVECRGAMLLRVNECLAELGESDEDNQ